MEVKSFEFPTDENGNPATQVSFTMEELIPTVQFGNAKIAATATTWVSDDSAARKQGIHDCVQDVKDVLAKERNTILAVLREKRIAQAQQS